MTDSVPGTWRTPAVSRPAVSPPRAVRGALCALAGIAALAAAMSGCGASSALGSAVLAPLSALPETDVVMETNLQSAVQGGIAGGSISAISSISGSGVPEVTGPPTSIGVVSVASTTFVSVYTAFNPADRHCLGTFVLKPGSPTAVLGETTQGTYDFWFGPTTATSCAASLFTSESTVPSGWASGDPSSTGWPLP